MFMRTYILNSCGLNHRKIEKAFEEFDIDYIRSFRPGEDYIFKATRIKRGLLKSRLRRSHVFLTNIRAI